jgi:hypothetical protein
MQAETPWPAGPLSDARGDVRHRASADRDRPSEQVAGPDQASGGRSEALGPLAGQGAVEGLQVEVEQPGEVGGDRRLQPEGVEVVA